MNEICFLDTVRYFKKHECRLKKSNIIQGVSRQVLLGVGSNRIHLIEFYGLHDNTQSLDKNFGKQVCVGQGLVAAGPSSLLKQKVQDWTNRTLNTFPGLVPQIHPCLFNLIMMLYYPHSTQINQESMRDWIILSPHLDFCFLQQSFDYSGYHNQEFKI